MANFSKLLSLINGASRTVDFSNSSNVLELGGGGLQMDGSTSGHIVISASAVTSTYSIVWPAAQAASPGYVLSNDGTGQLSWVSASAGSVTSVALALPVSVFSVSGSPVTSSGTLTGSFTTQSANTVFAGPTTGSAATPTFRSLVSADIPSLSGIYLALTGGTMSGAINMGGNKITNMGNPTSAQDAATKAYVDAAISGLTWKGPVAAYANVNVPLTGSTPLVIDGYTVANNDLLLLANQTTASQDGEYSASITGGSYTLTANGLPDTVGDAWLVNNGTVFAKSAFVATAVVPAATFTEFAGPTAYSFTPPLQLSGNTVSITQSTTSTNGYLSSTDWNTFNNKQPAGNYITALTGDVTASGPGSAAATLATVNGNVGSFGSSTSIPSFTVNAKGLITAASGNAVIAPAGTLTGTTLNATVVSSSLTSVGTIATGVWNGTAIGPTFGGTGLTSYTTGDTIYASASNVLSKLGIGSTGQVLTVVGGIPAWSTPSVTPGELALTQNHILVGNGSNVAADVAMSGDVAIVSSGATTIQAGAVSASKLGSVTDGFTCDQNGAGSTIEVLNSPSLKRKLTAGQSFNANTSYAVRWGLTSNGESSARIYVADITTSSFDLMYVIGMASSGTSVTAGQTITVTTMGSFSLSSSDTAFGASTDGLAVFLTASGGFSVTPPGSAGQAVTRIGIVQARSATNTANIIDVFPVFVGVN
jgi:hypothetical protein